MNKEQKSYCTKYAKKNPVSLTKFFLPTKPHTDARYEQWTIRSHPPQALRPPAAPTSQESQGRLWQIHQEREKQSPAQKLRSLWSSDFPLSFALQISAKQLPGTSAKWATQQVKGNRTSVLTATLYTGPPISIHSSAYQPNPFKSLRNSSAYFKECCYSNHNNSGFTLGYQQQFVWCNTFPLTQKETLKVS